MFVVTQESHETHIVKQSKFIAHLVTYNEFEKIENRLRAEHPKARHFVTAFRALNEFDQIVEGSSDDGEPKGTSGKPMLAVLRGAELINTAIICVRYFGGTKLGTGGLVRAYSDVANMAIGEAVLTPYKKEILLECSCGYSDLSLVEHILSQLQIFGYSKDFHPDRVSIKAQVTLEQKEQFLSQADRLIKRS